MGLAHLFPWIADVKGQIGGVQAIHRQGKLVLKKRKKPKLSMTAAAIRTRQVYATLETIWCNMRGEYREGYLLGCRVPRLSGRDLFTRINWHQVAEWDEYRPLPGDLQPMAAVKTHLDGNLAVPADWLRGLGGALHTKGSTPAITGRFARAASGTGATLAAAVAAAYASVLGKPWLPSYDTRVGWHLLSWYGVAYFTAAVDQGWAATYIPENLDCGVVDLRARGYFSGPSSNHYQGGILYAGAGVDAVPGWQEGLIPAPALILPGGPMAVLDQEAWGPLSPWPAPTQAVGWELSDLRLAWMGRG
jgi:hypothetical protein